MTKPGSRPLVAPDTLPYRPCVGIMLINAKGQVFVGRRIDREAEAWQMPQELLEEVGTDKARVVAEAPDWLTYDLPPQLLGRVWKGRYRGQRQKWFALRFLGLDEDIDLNTEHPEFEAWRWVDIETLPSLIVPFKRAIYTDLVERFRPFAVPQKD
jgi:putative (di)nucleoside polyphosphate hydrolase